MKEWFNKQKTLINEWFVKKGPIFKTWTTKQKESFSKWSIKQWKKFKEWLFKKPTPAPAPDPSTDLVKGLSLGRYFYGSIVVLVCCLWCFGTFSWQSMNLPSLPSLSGWTIVIILLLTISALLFFYREKLSRLPSKTRGVDGFFSGFLYMARIVFWGGIIIATIFYLMEHGIDRLKDKSQQSSSVPIPTETVSSPPPVIVSTSRTTKDKIRAGKTQLLKAGTTYVWDKKCKTYYFFEPTNKESATIKCVEQGGGDTIVGTIFRNEEGPDFNQKSGTTLLDEGTYNVTVDRDIMVHVRVKKKS